MRNRRALGTLLNCGINTDGSEQNLEKSPKEIKGLIEPQDWMVTRRNEFLCLSVKMWGSETQEEKAQAWQHLCVWAQDPWVLDLETFPGIAISGSLSSGLLIPA